MNRIMTRDPGLGRTLAFSLLLHVAVYGIIFRFGQFNSYKPVAQTYYVDIVNLPVANPQSGTPSKQEKTPEALPSTSRQEMEMPVQHREKAKTPVAKPVQHQEKQKTPVASSPAKNVKKDFTDSETEENFSKRIAHIENKVESQHESAALAAIRKKISANGRAGIPGGSGTEAGSDYAGYIQSRLRDAFKNTIAYQSGNPEVVVSLKINRYGKIIGYSMVKSSHDKLFEASVNRAIQIAGENFPPPPGNSNFEHGFIFRPEGVGKK
jgi:colicin import membrane protein